MMNKAQNSKVRWLGVGILLIAVMAVGWYVGSRAGGEVSESPGTSTETGGEILRDIAGKVIRLAPEDGTVTLDHEEIPGFMAAMRMDIQVADPAELEGLNAGDKVIFDLARIDGIYKAIRFRQSSEQDNPAQQQPPEPTAAPLGRGDLVPDLALFGAHGQTFRLHEMAPRHKVITFFYARCPLGHFCPAQSRRLAELQQYIEANNRDVHLISLTLDAAHDGPEVLAGYAEQYAIDPSRWTLAGSDDADAIRAFANRVGARIRTHDGTFEIDHALIGVRVDGQRIVDFVYGLDAIEQLIRGM